MVQRKSVRWIENKWHHENSPTTMMRALNLKPLETRRNISCVKMFYDIINGDKFMDQLSKPVLQRSKNVKFKCIHARLNVYGNSFFPFTIGLWNNVLPIDLANEKNENKFKSKLLAFF